MASSNLAASLIDIQKHYFLTGETVKALRGVSFDVPQGDFLAIMGQAAPGKVRS